MPQVFQVLKCYKCLVFQIHQTKKSNKFQCKMCGEKQSIKRHYGIGTGKDCRLHVQRLNGLRGEMEATTSQSDSDDELEDSQTDEQTLENSNIFSNKPIKRSRWSAFVDRSEEVTEKNTDEPKFLGDNEVVLEMPRKKKTRKFKVILNSSNNSEINLNILNTSNVESESNSRVSNFGNFESDKILKSIEEPSQKYCDKSIIYKEQLNSKHCNKPTICNNQKLIQKQELIHTFTTKSKWTQFVATQEENENIHKDSLSDIEHDKIITKSDNLFSLCDDSDLDNVLDI